MALIDLMQKLQLLKGKLSLYEQLKSYAESMRETNREAVGEVLLDLDEFCVAPLKEEIEKIEKAEVKIDGKRTRKGKAATTKPKGKGKGRSKR